MRLPRPLVTVSRRLLRRLGVEAQRYTAENFEHLRRTELLRSGTVTLLVDAGAHDGRWALQRRGEGYRGRIVSFEPQRPPFALLAARAAADGSWSAHPVALGAETGEGTLHVAASERSSSLAELDEEPVDTTTVPIRRLDDLVDAAGARVFLKADVQGWELQVLLGAEQVLRACVAVEVEVDYDGNLEECLAHLRSRGFRLVSLEQRNEPGGHVAANALFVPRGPR